MWGHLLHVTKYHILMATMPDSLECLVTIQCNVIKCFTVSVIISDYSLIGVSPTL